ncbi:competence protein CoiA family protein [Streptomyces harbinensis]|uniref:Competence protein CoiA nuclease-like domain-containing protein n=1 Tax=Streptomyces harbinensis TaxID=1176198 RepID=A0A1I6WBK6_9ACTN|nr:hypothetical protein [Streptomyces harbinensis]SFT23121.1 hypothetical protein SAMN05444716_11637 [Streptomyces harbinensis]
MANGVWHTEYGIEINLSRRDLGHPDRPGLLDEILTPTSQRNSQLLECLAHHYGSPCESERGGKSPWMFVRRGRAGSSRPLVAAHLPVTHKPTPGESDQHKAMKERVVTTAARNGLQADTEVRAANGRTISDAVVTGPDGQRIGWEIQFSPLGASGVRSRTAKTLGNGVFPLWVAKDPTAHLIDRAPWARINDTPWRDIRDGQHLPVRGGFRRFQIWRCTPRDPRPCPDGKGQCDNIHTAWSLPAVCVPEEKTPFIDTLVVRSATGEHVPVFVPSRADGRAGSYMWVPAADHQQWIDYCGEDLTPRPSQPGTDPDDVITFTEDDIDYTCRWGQETETRARTSPRPRRDTGQSIGRTFNPATHLTVIPTQRATSTVTFSRMTSAQRAAAAAIHRCQPWELGLCNGCSALMRRHGTNAAIFCDTCRRTLNNRVPSQAGPFREQPAVPMR